MFEDRVTKINKKYLMVSHLTVTFLMSVILKFSESVPKIPVFKVFLWNIKVSNSGFLSANYVISFALIEIQFSKTGATIFTCS